MADTEDRDAIEKKSISDWLLNQQHNYGYWQESLYENPVPLTVLVLDTLSLITENYDHLTFKVQLINGEFNSQA